MRRRRVQLSNDADKTKRQFLEKAVKDEGCWGWDGTTDHAGYSRLGAARAHRVSYELHVGEIPPGYEIDHQCRNRGCVNPDHLKAVTRKQNRENLGGAYKNNGSGVRGVHYLKRTGKWRVRVGHNGVVEYFGLYDTLEEAERVAIDARKSLFSNSLMDEGV